jgi:hypothetical protein
MSPCLNAPRHLCSGRRLKMVGRRELPGDAECGKWLLRSGRHGKTVPVLRSSHHCPLRYSAHAHARARRWWPSAIGTDDAAGADPPAASPADASTRRPHKQPSQPGHRLSGAQHKRCFPGRLPLAMATALALASRCLGHLKLFTPPPFVVPLPIYLDISWLG